MHIAPFEIPQKLSYIKRCIFYEEVKIWGLLDLRICPHFINGPSIVIILDSSKVGL